MKFKFFVLGIMALALIMAGCSNKGYVDERIAELQAKVDADMNTVKAKTDTNTEEIQRIKTLTQELSVKTDKALNQMKGFEDYQVIWEGVVNFDYDSQELNQLAQDNLEGLGQKMVDVPRSILEVAGHTDRSGSAKYNLMLGMRRAEAVKLYLVDKYGVPLYRMFTVSYGKTKPMAMPDERNANAKNRRVVLKLWGPLQ